MLYGFRQWHAGSNAADESSSRLGERNETQLKKIKDGYPNEENSFESGYAEDESYDFCR